MNRSERRAMERAERRHRHRWAEKSWGVQGKGGEWERLTVRICDECGAQA